MKEERIFTETESAIMDKCDWKKKKLDQVFTSVKISVAAEVFRNCGGRALLLFQTILAVHRIKRTPEYTLPPNLLAALGMSKSDLSVASKKLEGAGYIEIIRKPGHKNKYKLTAKGVRGLV